MPTTPHYGWVYPVVGANLDDWGDILNAGGVAIDAEMFKKANISNPIFTGNITAPAFIGNPVAILRPTVDGPNAIQLQSSAGTILAWMNTAGGGQLFVPGSITSPLYAAATAIMLRPGTDGGANIQFQSAAGAVKASIDTATGALALTGPLTTGFIIGAADINIRPQANSATAIQLGDASGTPYGVFNSLTKRWSFGNHILITDGGGAASLGVGTSSALARLDVVVSSFAYDAPLSGQSSVRFALGSLTTTEALLFGVHSSGYSWIQSILPGSAARPLYINPSGGNVAVGQSVANFALDVKGGFCVNSPNSAVKIRIEGTRDGIDKAGIGTIDNHQIVFHIANNPNMVLGPFGTCWFNKTASTTLYAMGAMPSYLGLAEAIAAGLTSGDLFRRSVDGVMFCV